LRRLSMLVWGAPEDEKVVESRFQALCQRFPALPPARLRRFFRWCSGNLDQATAMVQKNIEWQASTFPITPSSIEAYIRRGFFFRQGNDKEGRPVLMYWGSKLGSVPEADVEKAIMSMAHVLETTMREMSAADPNTRSEFVCIVFIDVGSALNRKMIQSALAMWQANYPHTLHRALIYPGTPLAQSLWGMIKWFLYAETREKVVIVSDLPIFQQYIHADMLAKCFGGNVERIGPADSVIDPSAVAPPADGAPQREEELAALREVEQFNKANEGTVAPVTEGKEQPA